MAISTLDWIIIGVYLFAMILLSAYLSRGQKNSKDYYLGGNNMGAFPIAISTMATQCSTTSILGAPAFVAFSIGGGLTWLQYELSIPLAMIFLMVFMLPLYRNLGIISVYEYLEKRFDQRTRMVLSLQFQIIRAFAAGVIIYGISIVISYCTGIHFGFAVLLLGVITIIYDFLGGMKAVVISDVVQMLVLYLSILLTIGIALSMTGGFSEALEVFQMDRKQILDFKGSGFDGNSFGFWPMFFGGFFLYLSYYGCDQTQVQRELSTQSVDDTNMSLFINGILRFPLALTYCFLGVCIGAFVMKRPEFIELLPIENGSPNFNMAVPVFVLNFFPVGFIGLFLVGLFSAAMSSLDSTINSLSATTLQDIVIPVRQSELTAKQQLWISKGLTVFWGGLCTVFSFFVGDISDSIVVSINKVGSLANGPILGVFLLGLLTKKANGKGALVGLFTGFTLNGLFWLYIPQVTWPWWNLIGCLACFAVGLLISVTFKKVEEKDLKNLTFWTTKKKGLTQKNWRPYYLALALWGVVIFGFCLTPRFFL